MIKFIQISIKFTCVLHDSNFHQIWSNVRQGLHAFYVIQFPSKNGSFWIITSNLVKYSKEFSLIRPRYTYFPLGVRSQPMAVLSPSESESESESESDIRSRGNGKRQHDSLCSLRCAGDGVTHAWNTFPKFEVPTGRVLGNTSVHFVHHPLRNRSRYSTFIPPTVQEKCQRRAISRKRDCCHTCSKSVAGKQEEINDRPHRNKVKSDDEMEERKERCYQVLKALKPSKTTWGQEKALGRGHQYQW